MANETVSPTTNESRLGSMLSEIASLAYAANELLQTGDLGPHEAGARVMLQLIGAIADRGTEFSNCGRCAMVGSPEAWLGLTNFEIATEAAHV